MEIWKELPGFEGCYTVSNEGQVWRNDYTYEHMSRWGMMVKTKKRGSYVKPKTNNRGYWQIRLYRDGVVYNMLLHRVVAMAFIPNIQNLPQINHKDENRDNNRPENLEWCTNLYNRHYGTGIQRMAENHDYKKLATINSRPVIQFDKNHNQIKRWPSVMSASRELATSESNIRQSCYGKRKYAIGFQWIYEDEVI